MTQIKYNKVSPYFTTQKNTMYLEVLNYRSVPALAKDKLIPITSEYVNRPDLLAYDLYGTTRLWWVFSVRNPNVLKDPIYDMKEGVEIYVTNKEDLLSILNA